MQRPNTGSNVVLAAVRSPADSAQQKSFVKLSPAFRRQINVDPETGLQALRTLLLLLLLFLVLLLLRLFYFTTDRRQTSHRLQLAAW